MISSKSLKYTVRILLGTLIGVYLGIIVLLNIPYVQGKLSVFVTKELKNILNTEVSIGRIDMGLLNRIIVEEDRILPTSGLLSASPDSSGHAKGHLPQ